MVEVLYVGHGGHPPPVAFVDRSAGQLQVPPWVSPTSRFGDAAHPVPEPALAEGHKDPYRQATGDQIVEHVGADAEELLYLLGFEGGEEDLSEHAAVGGQGERGASGGEVVGEAEVCDVGRLSVGQRSAGRLDVGGPSPA